MIDQEKDRDHLALGPDAHINVGSLPGRVVQIAALAPMHRAPNDRGCRGIGPAGGVNAQLTAEGVRRSGRGKGDAGPIACPRYDRHPDEKTGLESPAIAPQTQVGKPRSVMVILLKGKTPGQDKGRPADGYLVRGAADKAIETADRWRDEAGRVANGLSLHAPGQGW